MSVYEAETAIGVTTTCSFPTVSVVKVDEKDSNFSDMLHNKNDGYEYDLDASSEEMLRRCLKSAKIFEGVTRFLTAKNPQILETYNRHIESSSSNLQGEQQSANTEKLSESEAEMRNKLPTARKFTNLEVMLSKNCWDRYINSLILSVVVDYKMQAGDFIKFKLTMQAGDGYPLLEDKIAFYVKKSKTANELSMYTALFSEADRGGVIGSKADDGVISYNEMAYNIGNGSESIVKAIDANNDQRVSLPETQQFFENMHAMMMEEQAKREAEQLEMEPEAAAEEIKGDATAEPADQPTVDNQQ